MISPPRRRSSRARPGDSGGDDREPARTILLRFGRTVTQPTEAMKADSAGKSVARLALVELDRHLSTECRELEPVEHEQCALDPTDFTQGQRQAVLTRISTKTLEKERGARCAGSDRRCETRNVIPMRCDQIFVDAPGDEWLEHGPGSRPPEGVKASLRQIGDARRKIEAEQLGQSEGVCANAAAIGVVGRDTQISLVVEQAVDDIGGLSGRGYRDCVVWRLAGRNLRIKKRGGGGLVMSIDRPDSFSRAGGREVLPI